MPKHNYNLRQGIAGKFKESSEICQQLVRQLVHSLFGDNDRVAFHLCWKETVLMRKTSTNVLSKIVVIAKFPAFPKTISTIVHF